MSKSVSKHWFIKRGRKKPCKESAIILEGMVIFFIYLGNGLVNENHCYS